MPSPIHSIAVTISWLALTATSVAAEPTPTAGSDKIASGTGTKGTDKSEQVPLAVDIFETFQQKVFKRAAPSVVQLAQGKSLGSGFFVSPDGLILTNKHVVNKDGAVTVKTYDGASHEGTVIEVADGDLDLALVKISGGPFPHLKMAPLSKLRIGSWVATVGHGLGGAWTFTTGMISNIYPFEFDEPIVQTQIPINPGNSGGPILNKRGEAVAVVTAKVHAADNVNLSIRIDVAFKTLRGLAATCDCLVIRTGDTSPVFLNGTMVGKGPSLLVPVKPGRHKVMVSGPELKTREFNYPETRDVIFDAPTTKATMSEVAAKFDVMKLNTTEQRAKAVSVLPHWVGKKVVVNQFDARVVRGKITAFKPPETLHLQVSRTKVTTVELPDVKEIRRAE